MSEQHTEQDFLVSELLSELKTENGRKADMIRRKDKQLFAIVLGGLLAVLLTVVGFLVYLNQYDFTSTSSITNSAEGVYALIDSEGNVIAHDLTPEAIERLMEVNDFGESGGDVNCDPKED